MPKVSFLTPLGYLELGYNAERVQYIRFIGCPPTRPKTQGKMPKWLARLLRQLKRYFGGASVNFESIPISLDSLTPLQKKILKFVHKIPYGTRKSYGEIARALGQPKYARAVGKACHANPLPIVIPCHRVTCSNGKLGGYSQGLEMKKKLLELEGLGLESRSAEK